MGTAGTGKTYLIKGIRGRLREMTGVGSKSPVFVVAPTGVAAFNINGATIHSTLSIPITTNKHLDINGEKLKQLQDRLQNVRYVIIDEKSMVGRRMLGLIDMRLRQAFPEHNNEPFGGRSVIILGDFSQLPPVLDFTVYVNTLRDPLSNNGHAAYKLFKEVYKLNVVQRQSGNSQEQHNFRSLLLRLRDGESTLDDWKTLTTRFEEKLSRIERERFSDAMFLLTKWCDVNKINIEQLRSLNVPVAKILAVHTGGNEAKRAESNAAHGLESQLLLARGSRVMLTTNLWTEAGLVNGATGIVQDLLFEEDQGPPFLPITVLISFENYKEPTITSLEGEKVVPIAPIRRTWESRSGILCSCLQVPVRLAWAITVHKSQGLTLQKAVIDLGDNEFTAGLSFVAISRVRSLEDILFKHFTFERIHRIKDSKRLSERKNEEERLVTMIPRN
jgi:ATP-dependent DNA helicase PIF1